MIEGHTFVDAYFVDENYKTVESLWYSTEENVTRPYTVVADDSDKAWKKFLETPIDASGRCVTIDDLMERTYTRNKEIEAAIEESLLKAMNIKDEFISETHNTITKDSMNSLVKALLTLDNRAESTEEQNKERLFLFKLAIFEYEEFAKVKDKELKRNIRKAQTAIEVLYHLSTYLYHRT